MSMTTEKRLQSTFIQKLLLLCFFVCAYVYLLRPYPEQSTYGVMRKTFPMVCLIAYVSMTQKKLWADKYIVFTLIGLSLSIIGDIYLVYSNLLIRGGVVFKMAHIAYFIAIVYSGQQQGSSKVITCIFVTLFLAAYLFSQSLTDKVHFKIGLLFYYIPLFAVGWKAGCVWTGNWLDKTAILSFMAACLFINSDIVLIVTGLEFWIPHSKHIVMSTYYAAQALRAISTTYHSD